MGLKGCQTFMSRVHGPQGVPNLHEEGPWASRGAKLFYGKQNKGLFNILRFFFTRHHQLALEKLSHFTKYRKGKVSMHFYCSRFITEKTR